MDRKDKVIAALLVALLVVGGRRRYRWRTAGSSPEVAAMVADESGELRPEGCMCGVPKPGIWKSCACSEPRALPAAFAGGEGY